MRTDQLWLKRMMKLGLILMTGMTMSACAGSSGIGGDTWKEEVLLHDGQKMIVDRSQTYGGRHEVGQSVPVKEHSIKFKLPGSTKTITWTSEYGADLGRTNFDLVALHVLKDKPYLVTVPNLCLAYNKWGRPNPPYVIFKHEDNNWKRIPLNELPAEFKEVNLVVNNQGEAEILSAQSIVTAELVKKLNGELEQPEYKTILREPLPQTRINQMCEERVLYKGSWILPNDPIAREFIDRQKK
jgi:hypothetical protein